MIICLECHGWQRHSDDLPQDDDFFCSGRCERAYQEVEAKREQREKVADG